MVRKVTESWSTGQRLESPGREKKHQQWNEVVWQELGAVWTRSLWAGQGMGAFESGHAGSREWVESVQS